MLGVETREAATEAVRYWEPRRILYNAVLVLVVSTYFFLGLPFSTSTLSMNLFLVLFALAVLANIAYCAAYVVDIFAQTTGLRDTWLKYRWILFAIGVFFAAVITRFVSMGLFLRTEQ
jgi:hypothetical protein